MLRVQDTGDGRMQRCPAGDRRCLILKLRVWQRGSPSPPLLLRRPAKEAGPRRNPMHGQAATGVWRAAQGRGYFSR
jgi:hypothetical protein